MPDGEGETEGLVTVWWNSARCAAWERGREGVGCRMKKPGLDAAQQSETVCVGGEGALVPAPYRAGPSALRDAEGSARCLSAWHCLSRAVRR